MTDLGVIFGICEQTFKAVAGLSREELLMVLGMTIDYHAATHNGNPADYIETLATVSKQVNDTMGRMEVEK